LFIDEGQPMRELLSAATMSKPMQKLFREAVSKPKQKLLKEAIKKPMHDYLGRLLHAFDVERLESGVTSVFVPGFVQPAESLIEPLSRRELEVLRLIADGLSNRQISERLFVALSTVKGHNRMIFDKLQATRRTEAVARARERGLL
ncbi:LuxR family transcriptional regulator, partial [Clostridium perfringens]